ncbi:MAG: hypothetical protein Q8N54_01175 [Sulfurimicrobium sp.]|nr:hypothetical protein [Sulfurimicrobium sp.]
MNPIPACYLLIKRGRKTLPIPSGTLKPEHLHFLRDAIPCLEVGERDMSDLAASIPHEVYDMLLPEDFSWAECYELTAKQNVILLFWSLGLSEHFGDSIKKTGNANQAVIELVSRFLQDGELLNGWLDGELPATLEEFKNLRGGPGGVVTVQEVAGLIYAVLAQVYALRKHGRFMSELVADVAHGKEESFWHAVKIDPTVLACPTFARRMSIAHMRNEEEFFSSLANTLKAKGGQVEQSLDPLRVILHACSEGGWLDLMTMDETDQLFIQELNVYSNEGKDPVGGLQRFINRWKNKR